jgi:putative hydrolase of the HAD superfamily
MTEKSSTNEIFDALWRQFKSGNRRQTFNEALTELGIYYDEKLIEKLVSVYRNHAPKISLPEDSRDALEQLKEKYILALLTDGFLPAQKLKVQALGIEGYLNCIIYSEQLGREFWKPSPEGLKKLLQILNTKAETTAFVADNEMKDFIAPNQLGIVTIQITRPARLHTKTSEEPWATAKYKINKISQLPALLARL